MDIRWKQRFENLSKAFLFLKKATGKTKLSDLEKAGIIQIYEFTFELAWKTLKDFLEEEGFQTKYPRDTIKTAFQSGIIDNGDMWIDMLEKRNLMLHTYNETNAELAYKLISEKYCVELEQVYLKLKGKL